MLSRPVFGVPEALQSTITILSNSAPPPVQPMIMMMLVRVRVIVIGPMIVVMPDPGAAHVMVMPLLRRADGIVVSDDARAVFAELAVHRRLAGVAFVDAVEEGIDDPGVIAQIAGLGERDLAGNGRRRASVSA